MESRVVMALVEQTGENVSVKSIPGRCMYPFPTSRILNLNVLSALRVTRKAQRVEITFVVGVQGAVWVSLRSRAPTSFKRAACQNGAQTPPWNDSASSIEVGQGGRPGSEADRDASR